MIHRQHDPVQRLNAKHGDELLAIARSLGGHPEAASARVERVDSWGIDLALTTPSGLVASRINFSEQVSDPKWMRRAFKDLTKRAKAALP